MVGHGLPDPALFVGTSEIGWFFAEAYAGSDPELVDSESLVAKIDGVRTQTLAMHSESDNHCQLALALAQRYYPEFKQRGIPPSSCSFRVNVTGWAGAVPRGTGAYVLGSSLNGSTGI